jgi:hypothetical protein
MHLRLGPLEVWIGRLESGWRVLTRQGGNPLEENLVCCDTAPLMEPPEDCAVHRFASGSSGDAIVVRPMLADRSIVTRPTAPVTIPAGDSVDLFVSTPIWLRIELPRPVRLLLELPTSRPTDTWLGATTRYGDPAYACRTAAQLLLGDLPPRSHRAVTRVSVRNRASESLRLARLSVPVPSLALYRVESGNLWTQPVIATLAAGSGGQPLVELGATPDGARQVELMAQPREETSPTAIKRALQVLLG